MTSQEKIQILIEAQDRASGQLRNVQSSLGGITNSMQNLMQLGGIGLAVGGLQQALDRYLDLGKTGADLVNLERSFQRFAATTGDSADEVLANMQRMSNGVLTQTEAMQQYNRAFLLMGEEMAAKMPELIQVATAASAAGMGDFQYLLNSLVIGLGRTSPLILDNLGFTVKLSDAYEAYAQTVGKSASELSKAEQQQALLNAVMADAEKKFGGLGEGAAVAGTSIAAFRAALVDLKDDLTKSVAPEIDAFAGDLGSVVGVALPVIEALVRLREAERDIAVYSEGATGAMQRMQYGAGGLSQALSIATGAANLLGEAAGTFLAESVLDQVRALSLAGDPMARYVAGVLNLKGAFEDTSGMSATAALNLMRAAEAEAALAAGAHDAQLDMKALNSAIGSTISLVANLSNAARTAGGILADMSTDFRVSMMKASDYMRGVTKPQMDWFTTGKQLWELPEAMAEYGRAMGTYLEGKGRDAWSQHNQGLSAAVGGYSDLQGAMESYYDSWASQAAGILAPTQDFDLNALTEEVYGYQDKWDEAARRAMDVVKRGTDSPWAADMGLGGKEDALQYVRDFYAGRLPDDVNWDSAIGQYQMQMEQMVGQQNLAAMFQEQLQSAGWGPENEAVMAALGAPMESAGLEAAGTFATSFVGVDWKAQVGDPVGKFIADGVAKAFENSDPRFTGVLEGMVMRILKNYLGGGGSTP